MISWLLVAHVVVLGYWLGSELVINSTYRLVCYSEGMPFQQRATLMDHVMVVDQHVRYALVLQATLGVMLAASLAYVPGGQAMVIAAAGLGIAWLVMVEAVHRLRERPVGLLLARLDRGVRYLLMGTLLAIAIGWIGGAWPMPLWLRWKVAAFAGVMACGVGIRFALMKHFKTWARMAQNGATAEDNAIVQRTYLVATSILVMLWILIALATLLSVTKPG